MKSILFGFEKAEIIPPFSEASTLNGLLWSTLESIRHYKEHLGSNGEKYPDIRNTISVERDNTNGLTIKRKTELPDGRHLDAGHLNLSPNGTLLGHWSRIYERHPYSNQTIQTVHQIDYYVMPNALPRLHVSLTERKLLVNYHIWEKKEIYRLVLSEDTLKFDEHKPWYNKQEGLERGI